MENKSYSLILCDDESAHADYLESMFNRLFTCFQIMKCNHKNTLMDLLENNKVDGVLLDIQMKDQNGIQIGTELRKLYPKLKIVYVSGHPEYIQDVFEVEPSYFILKPVNEEKLKRAVKFVFAKDEVYPNKLIIHQKGENVLLQYDEILYVESDKRILNIKCINGESFKVYMKLANAEKELPDEFVRCHQSFIVNLMHVKSFNYNSFLLKNNEEIPISQRKSKDARNVFYDYLRREIRG